MILLPGRLVRPRVELLPKHSFLPVYFIRVDLLVRGGYCYVAVAVVFD